MRSKTTEIENVTDACQLVVHYAGNEIELEYSQYYIYFAFYK